MSEISKFIGQRIRNYRTQQKLSQKKLAKLSVCHPTYIGQLERGNKNATLESIEKIVSALGVPLSKLLKKPDYANACDSIPLKCYKFFSAKSKAEQLYCILIEMDKYKSE